jgi:hypothetical protein
MGVPETSVAEAMAQMEAIGAALPAADGLACFNSMYLDVTRQVNSQLSAGFFADPAFMAHLDVTFANLYLTAADAAGNRCSLTRLRPPRPWLAGCFWYRSETATGGVELPEVGRHGGSGRADVVPPGERDQPVTGYPGRRPWPTGSRRERQLVGGGPAVPTSYGGLASTPLTRLAASGRCSQRSGRAARLWSPVLGLV